MVDVLDHRLDRTDDSRGDGGNVGTVFKGQRTALLHITGGVEVVVNVLDHRFDRTDERRGDGGNVRAVLEGQRTTLLSASEEFFDLAPLLLLVVAGETINRYVISH